MVEEAIRKETQVGKGANDHEGKIEDVCTEDENDEVEYEAWKLRELKRIKRDREEREQYIPLKIMLIIVHVILFAKHFYFSIFIFQT